MATVLIVAFWQELLNQSLSGKKRGYFPLLETENHSSIKVHGVKKVWTYSFEGNLPPPIRGEIIVAPQGAH